MKVPFVNYPLQYHNIKEEVDSKISDILNRGDLILRRDVEEFEEKLAKFVGTKYAVGLNSCTDGLFFSLKALGIGDDPDDEVITVSHTFVASISVIVQAGAKPVLVDVGDDFLIDISKIEEAITENTKAIIPVDLNGRVCDMEKIMEIAEKHNLYVIEDSAQALGGKFKGKMAGSWGITGNFSFYPAKVLGCFGDGGAITTNDGGIAEKIRLFRDHGQKTKREIILYGWNSRLDNIQAGILNIKIKYLPEWIKRRREIASIYDNGLKEIAEIKLPPVPDSDGDHFDIFQNYVLRAERRDELFNYLKNSGVETLIKDPIANHKQKSLHLLNFHLPISEKLANEVISLPMYPELTNKQVEYVIKQVKEFYQS